MVSLYSKRNPDKDTQAPKGGPRGSDHEDHSAAELGVEPISTGVIVDLDWLSSQATIKADTHFTFLPLQTEHLSPCFAGEDEGRVEW